ncbi:aldehyde dehydrogenase family protein [Luteolibacter ambystomatis]|uniref:Aldehyde dehydrogenase family protein n=1 Tax=Luteolibacter ambystomatis TaxID=2824561 RepID=A0A975IYJ8_9BACT|nr:aldehyde dehydrogenase family protein [Luteolibacter ambystomatis]QUE50312.1 aldehyde dehydrogenase family protein [Luteolibacter ambystomatis]
MSTTTLETPAAVNGAATFTPVHMPAYIAGRAVETGRTLEVRYPYDGSLTGTAALIGHEHLDEAIKAALEGGKKPLSRHERSTILRKAAALLAERREEFARLITRETGLCMKESRYETGRSSDVLEFAAMEALRDDGQVFSCDISPMGKPRKIFTTRYPVNVIAAITPFNHPLNQVAHKLAPAIAAGAPTILKPSERTPLTALKFAALLYEAGLPGWMLSMFLGTLDEVINPMIEDERTEVVTFTGSVEIGKAIAKRAGYKKLCLELGGNSPLIVLEDADLDLAAKLACEGSFRNSGQRCTAVKRILVQESILEAFTEKFVELAKTYKSGDPEAEDTVVGTVITEDSAKLLERRVHDAVKMGAKVLLGGNRKGALLEPTVIANVPRDAEMVHEESFGPLGPIVTIKDLDDAINYYNSGRFGLSSAIVTNNLQAAMRASKELKTGTTNVNEVPGYRLEHTPFGGVRDSGLGIKEGVVEAMKFFTHVKTFSLPW